MVTLLVVSILVSLTFSFLCSLAEAALYSVPVPYVKNLAESGSRSGLVLDQFKSDLRHPITAILTLNTVAHTCGASVSGWAFAELFGSAWLGAFSGGLTLAILWGTEIVPKMLGVTYCRAIARAFALPLNYLISVLWPLIVISLWFSSWFEPGRTEPQMSDQEVLTMAVIGTEEGALDQLEGSVISNIIELDKVLVRDILTPRVVVFRMPEETKLKEISSEMPHWTFSRIPLYSEADPDQLTGYVIQRDLFRELIGGGTDAVLKQLARPLATVPELMRADRLLLQMVEKREHICAVVDEHGALAGIVTLEDVIEEVVGREIVDEYDTISDLRTYAKDLRKRRKTKLPNPPEARSTKIKL